ncbi:IS66 family insertion sequence element accessory protein TnpB [Lachnospiraceae bacterium MD308]|nr:IS66 family insertion sequence element accessory protein TnpB [Lachnospiraceae bacterium MD308]
MLNLITQGAEHIYLACGPTDFRKQIEGLAALVSLRYQLDPYSPACVFLFCNRKKNCLKALRFDKDGFLLATKKLLPDMVFQWPKSKEEIQNITPQQVRWLLEGLSIEQKKAHKTVQIRPEDTCF